MASKSLSTSFHEGAVSDAPGVGQLSFASRWAGEGANLWDPDVSGWAEQCSLGRAYGREAVDYIRSSGDAAALGGIVRAMVDRGSWGGVEVGFFTAISLDIVQST